METLSELWCACKLSCIEFQNETRLPSSPEVSAVGYETSHHSQMVGILSLRRAWHVSTLPDDLGRWSEALTIKGDPIWKRHCFAQGDYTGNHARCSQQMQRQHGLEDLYRTSTEEGERRLR